MVNINFANTSNYKLEIPGFEEVNYFIQSVNFPSITMESIEVPFRTNLLQVNTNTPVYSPLNISFLMDENFETYKTLTNWMLSFIDDDSFGNLVKDIKLHILSANKKPLIIFTYIQSFPTSIPEVMFDSSIMDTDPIIFTVEFRYQKIQVE